MNRRNINLLLKYLGRRSKEFRKKSGYTIEEAAEYAHVPPRNIAAYENGERQIYHLVLIALAELYSVTVEELIDSTAIRKKLRLYHKLTGDEEPIFDYRCLELNLEDY